MSEQNEEAGCEVSKSANYQLGNRIPPTDHKMGVVMLNNKQVELWWRTEEHSMGKMNNCNANMWVKQPVYVDIEHETSNECTWIPWVDIGARRHSFEIEIKEGNRTKYSWGDVDIRRTGTCVIKCNGHGVAEFGFGDIGYAFGKAQQLVYEISEHPAFDPCDPNAIIGRKVWYDRLPAIVESWCCNDLFIVPDPAFGDKFDFSGDPTRSDFVKECDYDYEDGLRAELLSHHIDWFREE